MEQPVLMRAIERLARAGEEAGISVEDMIRILNAVSVEVLLDLIERDRVRNVDALPAGLCSRFR